MLRALAAPLLASALCALPALADPSPAFLVKDLDATVSGSNVFNLDSSAGLADVGGVAYYFASTLETGYELWRSDRTEAGTARVKDIRVGTGPLEQSSSEATASPTNVNGTLFFTYDDGVSGRELWKSDGTSAGTVRVKDIRAGSASSDPMALTAVGSTLYFTADDGVSGRELWKSDGTETGTVRVKDIWPGPDGIQLPWIDQNQLVDVDGTLFLTACNPSACYGLWKSDGTDAGTVLVKSFESYDPRPFELTAVDDRVYFWILTGSFYSARAELWTSDGTGEGTVSIAFLTGEIEPYYYYDDFSLTSSGGALFFTAEDPVGGRELWMSNGTAASTVRVKDIVPGAGGSFPGSLTDANGTLFFSAQDAANGRELWKSDGTEAGTVLVKDVVPGTSGSDPTFLTNVDGTLFFSPLNGSSRELWKSDGTEAGTVLVSVVGPDAGFGSSWRLANVGGALFYVANGGVQLWASDGTPGGTHEIAHPQGGAGSFPNDPVVLNGTVYFSATTLATGWELWQSDGTAEGTLLLKDIVPGPDSSFAGSTVNANGTLFFSTGLSSVWKSDGTASGTVWVRSFSGLRYSVRPRFTNVNGTVFFDADDGGPVSSQLYKSDGTAPGTVAVKAGTAAVSSPDWLTPVNGTLFLSATVPFNANERELYRSDGTNSGTFRVKDIAPGSSSPAELTDVSGSVFFSATDGTSGRELWKSDGTDAGTVRVKDIYPGATGSNPQSLASIGGTIYFAADDGTSGSELWKSDGTDAGTVRVKDILPGSGGSGPAALTNLNGTLLFVADDGVTGRELWKSDGTEAGTVLVEERRPGSAGSSLDVMVVVGSRVVFVDNDGVTGEELWTSDGTAAGTHLVADIAPIGGSQFISPSGATSLDKQLAQTGSLLLFAAHTDATNRELYAVPIAALDDGDQDGLADQTEVALGTNPDVADSDGDGLADGAEVNTHGTNPLVADTDGDSYSDGEEIVGGSDPLDPQSVPHAVPLAGPLALGALAALLLLLAKWTLRARIRLPAG